MKHQHTQLFLWTIVVDIFIPVGRYLRKYTRFFDGHSMPLTVVLILSLVFRDNEGGSKKSLKDAHEALSIVLIVLTALIGANGIVLRLIIEFDKWAFQVKNIKYYRWLHGALGVCTWAIARTTVFLGTIMHSEQYTPLCLYLVIIETCVFVLLMLLFEFLRYREFKNKPQNLNESNNKEALKSEQRQMIEDIRSGVAIAELKKKYPKQNILIFMNKIYDLGYYLHPGGQFIFEECRFREVSRFLYGAVGLERLNAQQWRHSTQAFNLLNDRCIGDLVDYEAKNSDLVLTGKGGASVLSTTKTKWYLAARKMISGTTAILQFKTEHIRVKLTCKGTEWMGRHFIVSNQEKSRPYTNCTSLATESMEYRKALIEYFEILVKKGTPGKVPTLQESIDYLPFCIKQYEGPGALSKSLVSEDQSLNYDVEGPIGRGIEIPQQFSGQVIMIAGGTGILPFLDLLEFLLKKAIYEVCKQNELNASFIQPSQDYSVYYPNAKFTFLGAFRSVDDFVGLDIVSNLVGVCQKNKLDMFDAMVKVKGLTGQHGIPTTESHFNLDLMRQYINNPAKQLILICGPPPMQATLHSELLSLNVPNDNIVFV